LTTKVMPTLLSLSLLKLSNGKWVLGKYWIESQLTMLLDTL
jgi:hypothetical protein